MTGLSRIGKIRLASLRKLTLLGIVAALLSACTTASFEPVVAKKTGPPVSFDAELGFSEEAVRNGVVATKEQCDRVENAVWAQTAELGQACLRYWASGFSNTSSNRAVVYFAGDCWHYSKGLENGCREQTTARLKANAESSSKQLGVPYVVFARPGVFGSSGDHMQRRRPAESKLISAGLDALKKRLKIDEFVLAGQSGGGHVTASLITLRSDVVCAVPASAPSSPRIRWQTLKWTRDATGYEDSYEPHEHLDKSRMHPKLRVFVLGDPNDKEAVWASQTVLADKLRAAAVPVDVLTGEGVGTKAHGLGKSAITVAGWCANNVPSEEIVRRAATGLRG
jgi:dienelactone hydrolase